MAREQEVTERLSRGSRRQCREILEDEKMAKFRKKPVVIEAVRFTGDNDREIDSFTGGLEWLESYPPIGIIKTLEGDLNVVRNDWVIKGVKGEFYPCKPDIFEATYESA